MIVQDSLCSSWNCLFFLMNKFAFLRQSCLNHTGKHVVLGPLFALFYISFFSMVVICERTELNASWLWAQFVKDIWEPILTSLFFLIDKWTEIKDLVTVDSNSTTLALTTRTLFHLHQFNWPSLLQFQELCNKDKKKICSGVLI